MNTYEIVLVIFCFIFTTIFTWIALCFKDKIEELDDEIERLYVLDDMKDAKLERLEDDVYALMDNNKADKKIGVGKWIRIDSDGTYGISYWYACSICHNKVPKSQYNIDYFSPYCPACGAKMEGKE